MKKTSNREAGTKIANREPFVSHTGSFRGVNVEGQFFMDFGRMPGGDEYKQINAARRNGTLTYIVYSYNTPIAWVIGGKMHKTAYKYSVTTSKHWGCIPTD